VHSFKFSADFNSPLEHILAMSREFDLTHLWNRYVLESLILAEPSIFQSTLYAASWLPFPFPHIDVVVEARGIDLADVCLCCINPPFVCTLHEAIMLPVHIASGNDIAKTYIPSVSRLLSNSFLDAVLLHRSQQTMLSHVQLHAAHRDLPHHDLVAAPVAKRAVPLHVITVLTLVSCEHSACVANVVPRAPLHQPYDCAQQPACQQRFTCPLMWLNINFCKMAVAPALPSAQMFCASGYSDFHRSKFFMWICGFTQHKQPCMNAGRQMSTHSYEHTRGPDWLG